MQASAFDPDRRRPASTRWPVAPWRVAMLLACAVLALLAARSAWLDGRAESAAAADPELMSLVAAQWAAAEAPPRPAGASRDVWIESSRRNAARVSTLLATLQEHEPHAAIAVDPAHEAWQTAQRNWLARLANGTDARGLAESAGVAARSSEAFLHALRERAEKRRSPKAARPGVMLAVASLGLLLVGSGLPRASNATPEPSPSQPPADALGAEPPAAEDGTVAVGLLQQQLAEAFARNPEASERGCLFALQLAWPADCTEVRCAEHAQEVRCELVRRLRGVLAGCDAIALAEAAADGGGFIAYVWALRPDAELAPRLLAEASDAYTLHDHPHRLRVRLGLRELGSASDAASAWNELQIASAQAWQGQEVLVVFTPALGRWQQRASAFNESLQQALSKGEIRTLHEPVVELASGRVIGLRISAVWTHATHGEWAAAGFMPEAEEAGCATRVSQMVWRDAAGLLAGLQSSLGPDAPRWIQLPGWPHVWQDAGMPERLRELLAETGLPAAAVQVLLAEPLLAEMADLPQRVAALRALGVGVAIEGLGHASASLSWLSRLPVSTVMIDPQFTAGVPGNETYELLISAIVSLTAEPGSLPCADGVADDSAAEALRTLGVRCGLGAHFARPMPAAALVAWLHQRKA